MDAKSQKPVLFLDCTPWYGGAQRSLATLILGLRDRGGLPVLLAADSGTGGLLDSCRTAGVECHILRARHWRLGLGGLLRFGMDWWRFGSVFRDAVRSAKPALIHSNGVRAALLLAGRRTPGIPLVLHVRDVRLPEFALRMTSRHAERVIAVSECVAEPLRALVGRGKVRVVHNGFDLDAIRAAAQPVAPSPWPAEHLTAVLVADMAAWKRHELFLDAVRHAQSTTPELRAIIVGRPLTGPGEKRLDRLRQYARKLGLTDSVRFVADAENAVPWIAAADVLVSVAEREPFGRAVVEALALGKPVVAVRGGGPEEVLSGLLAGTLVDATAPAVAEGIQRWRLPRERRLAAASATARAECFQQTRMLDEMVALYTELC